MKLFRSLARRADYAVSVFSPQACHFFDHYRYRIENWFRTRELTREWATTTLRLTRPGWHVTRKGEEVYVRPNTDGVYDKLAFTVHRSPDTRWLWTVDERGWSYPHSLDGNIQRTPMDIVL